MDLILLNLRPEPEAVERDIVEHELPLEETGGPFLEAVPEPVLEIFNPFEWLGCMLEEPRAALILLVLFGVVILGVIVVNGMWNVIQEALSGGGPPQGFGLR